jgi:MoaA/NifB/PqqE/SkfB family radical SAM enzyme
MNSDGKKQSFMRFDTVYKILKEIDVPSIVQLEGGEPTTHPQLYLFLEYISTLGNVQEIVIDTNALTLDKHIDKIVDIAVRNKKPITVKPSYNAYLRTAFSRGNFADYITNIISACEFIPYVRFAVNVRGYSDKELGTLKDELPKKIQGISNSHLFNSYGRAENDKTLPDLQINEVYDNWSCYASDGECFRRDLKERAKYESKL